MLNQVFKNLDTVKKELKARNFWFNRGSHEELIHQQIRHFLSRTESKCGELIYHNEAVNGFITEYIQKRIEKR